ncbi:TerB family tellurite resistance protein [Leptodesmis sp.]|uniref:TerB family tellurite resistance protein n=1 Tax=Leptodesmis sp. TaxID=3100501 RepID=UPI004053599D
MVVKQSLEHCESLGYGFLLLAHIICADQQIHNKESRALQDLAKQVNIHKMTLQEAKKILGQDDTYISLEKSAQNVPVGQRSEVLKQILAFAYIDGYFSPLEREVVNQIVQTWGIDEYEIEQMLEYAQGFSQWCTSDRAVDDTNKLSVGARLLKGEESVLSRSLITN